MFNESTLQLSINKKKKKQYCHNYSRKKIKKLAIMGASNIVLENGEI